jgi:hypothetical protein
MQTAQQALDDRTRELAKVKDDYQKVVEAHRLEAQRTADLNACVGPLQKQLVQAQTLAGEATRQARDTIGEMESRCRVLAEKFEAEKRRNGDMGRELGAAYEAARILQVRNKGVEAVRPVNHHLGDLVEWKEQALRTLQSQRAALNAMSQTQTQTSVRIAAAQGSSMHDENYHPGAKPAKEEFTSKPTTQSNGSFASTGAPSQSHAMFDTTQVSEQIPEPVPATPEPEPASIPGVQATAVAGLAVPAWLVRATSEEPSQRDARQMLDVPETVWKSRPRRIDACSELSSVMSERNFGQQAWWMNEPEPKKKKRVVKKTDKTLKRAASAENFARTARTANRVLLR